MKNFSKLTRRDLIKTFGFAGVMATPLLRQTRAFAQSSMQQIYIQLFKPNGNPHNSYYPNGEGSNFNFNTPANEETKVTESLEYVKEYVISPREIEIYKDGGNAHSEGMVRNFTNSTSIEEIHNAKNYKPCIASSIDHIIADRLYQNDPSRLRHFHFNYRNRLSYGGFPLDTVSYKLSQGADRAQPQYAVTDLQQMFNTLLGRFGSCDGGNSNNGSQNPKMSVLDYNLEQVKDLKRKLSFSTNEKAKLEEYENQIETIQNNIQSVIDRERECPELLTRENINNDEGFERARTIMDLIVLSVEWELTHVASFQFDSAQGGGQYRDYLDLEVRDENHHGLSHEGGADGIRSFRTVSKFQWDNFGYLLRQLKDKKTINDQSLLDVHLALVSGGDVSMTEGSSHRHDKMPFFTVGKANGALQTGYTFAVPENNRMNAHGRLLLSVCHAMGLKDLNHIGDQDKCPGGPMIDVF